LISEIVCNLIFGVANAPAEHGETEATALAFTPNCVGRAVERLSDFIFGKKARQGEDASGHASLRG
jgi:hypothetical protein